MDLSWSAEQLQLKEQTAAFAREQLGSDLAARDRDEVFDRAGWDRCASFGLSGLIIPSRLGGRGLDPVTAALVLETLGYGCPDNGLLFALGAHLWGCAQSILLAGSAEQQERYLPLLASGGKIGALAVTEAGAGSDIAGIQTTARRAGADYVLSGRKSLITNGPLADLVVVLAGTGPERSSFGLSCFILERGLEGLTFGPNQPKMGMRTAALGEIVLQNCIVSAAQRLGREGAGMALVERAMEWERGMILAPAVGGMQRLLERCCDRARTRRQFGVPIGQFQHVSAMLVDMKLKTETSRALLYQAAWLKQRGRPSAHQSALAKLHISEAWILCCQHALQIHGGFGYLTESEVERELRDALASRLYSGTSELLKSLLARQLLTR